MSADRHAGRRQEVELDAELHLALDEQVVLEGEGVDGDVDRALDRVLDADEAEVDAAVVGGGQHLGDRGHRHELVAGQVGLRQQRLLGEGALGTEEADATARGRSSVVRHEAQCY